MPKTTLPNIIEFKERFSEFNFKPHEVFHWSPKDNCIYYNERELSKPKGIYQLLHEIGHAISNHTTYISGVQLLRIETEAWQRAQEVAAIYGLSISQAHIERCLDSYRDWLHLRSKCPSCSTVALETDSNHYHCFNCFQRWKVPSNQRTRSYRLKRTYP